MSFAGTVWSPAAALSKSNAELKPLPVRLCESRPPASVIVSVSDAPSPVIVTVVPEIAEPKFALAMAGAPRAPAVVTAATARPRRRMCRVEVVMP